MNHQRPKDCVCGFPKHNTTTNHGHWCPAHVRLTKRHELLHGEDAAWQAMLAKDAWGRYAAGTGPKPQDWED